MFCVLAPVPIHLLQQVEARQGLHKEEGDDEASAWRRDKLKRHLERQKELDAAAQARARLKSETKKQSGGKEEL